MAAVLDPGQHSPSGRHALRDRLSAVGASATLVASLLVVAAIGAPTVLAAAPDHFVVSVSGDQVAGAPFDVTVTAEDASNVADPLYTGGAVLSGLAASPGCGDCNPGLTGIAPDYGTAPSTWVDGVGTFTGVVAYNAEPGATVTATDDTAIGTSDPFAVSPAADLAGFTIGSISSQIAGATTTVTVTAYDLYGNVNSNYDGTSTAALSGLATSPGCGGCNPLIPTSAASYGSSSWAAGVGSWTGATPFKADTLAQLTVTDSSASVSNTSNIFNVDNGTILGGFTIDSVGTTHTAGGSFPVTIHAYDLYGNPKLDYTGGAVLDGLATSPGCSGCVPGLTATPADYGTISWANGVGTTSVTAFNAQSGAQLTITDGSISNTSNTFDVNPATALKGFTFTTVGTKTAGATTTVTVTAYDLYGNVNSNYDGTSTAALSGLATSPGCGGCNPLIPTSAASYGSSSWAAGVGSWTGATPFKADTLAQLTVTDSSASVSNTSNIFNVDNGTILGGFTIDSVGTTHTAGGSFPVTIHAYDLYGNPKLDYTGGTLSGLVASPGCSTCNPGLTATAPNYGGPINWANGVGTTSVTAFNAQSGAQLTITDGSISNTSNTFDVNPATALKGFTFTTVGTQVAGIGFNVAATAYDLYGNVNTNYVGAGAVLSGLATSSGCPTCNPALTATPATYGTPSWTNGISTFSGVLAYKAAASAVTVTAGSVSNTSNTFTVNPATALKGLTVANVNTQTAGNGFNPVVTAYDLYGNVNTNYGGGAILSGLATSPGCSGCTPVLTTTAATYGTPSWTLGVGTFSGVLAYKAASSTLTVTDSSASVSNASNSFTVNPALALKGFTVAHVNDQTAGAVGGFSVVVTAYDLYGNLNTNYSGGAALSGLATSPGCTGCSPNLPAKVATYGSPSWVGGVGTFSGVLAYKATKSDSATNVTHVTVMDTPASVSAVTNDFVVSPALVNALWFNAQPIDAQVNSAAAPTAVYALCAPSTTAPCALAGTPPAGSGAVAVTAVDAFGNLVLAQNIVMSGTGLDTNVTRPTAGGVATFGDALKESTTGNGRTLVATAALNGSANKTSGVFRVVTTLKGCAANNTKCINKALGNTNSKTYVNSWSQITTGTCFYCGTTNVLQSTQLVVNSTAPQCGITAFASDQVDQRVTGSNTQVTSSGLELIVIPKNTLKSSGFLNRSPSNFNVCFGAIWIGAGSPPQGWLGKTGATNNTPLRASPVDDQTVVPQGQRWYGIPADCGTAGLSSSDPCILKRTKQKSDIQTLLGADAASIMTDADLGIVIRVGGSWDGGSHPF